jgi:lipopolysaccharide biosynthesis regulator YciM
VARNLRFHADLHGLPRALATQRITDDCTTAGLAADLDRAVVLINTVSNIDGRAPGNLKTLAEVYTSDVSLL